MAKTVENLGFLNKRQVRLHVYKLPGMLNRGYAFHGGNDVPFLNVDFFDVPWDVTHDEIIQFIRSKRYFNEFERFLVIAESEYPTLTFPLEPTREPASATE